VGRKSSASVHVRDSDNIACGPAASSVTRWWCSTDKVHRVSDTCTFVTCVGLRWKYSILYCLWNPYRQKPQTHEIGEYNLLYSGFGFTITYDVKASFCSIKSWIKHHWCSFNSWATIYWHPKKFIGLKNLFVT
jgi:hypothetical protein